MKIKTEEEYKAVCDEISLMMDEDFEKMMKEESYS